MYWCLMVIDPATDRGVSQFQWSDLHLLDYPSECDLPKKDVCFCVCCVCVKQGLHRRACNERIREGHVQYRKYRASKSAHDPPSTAFTMEKPM